MKNWQNRYVAMVQYRRGTMSIYRIYFRSRERFHEWFNNRPKSYQIQKVEY